MRKIGLIADPHANLNALEAVLDDMSRLDKIICAGDLVGYGPQPNEVVELIKSENILSILGNHDHTVATGDFGGLTELAAKVARWSREEMKEKNLNFMKNLPEKEEMEEEGYQIFMAHGTPRNPLREYLYPGASNRALVKMTQGVDTDIVVLGHTHVPLERVIQGKLIVNPGAVGQPRDQDPKASYMILKLGREKEIIHKRVPYNIEETEKKLKNSGLPEKLAIRLHFGW